MELNEIRTLAAELFPQAVGFAVANPGKEGNAAYDRLHSVCWENYQRLGFSCMADLFGEVAPKTEGKLTLENWSKADVTVDAWTVRVNCRPFSFGSHFAHIELRHNGPLPGVTETGYRSIFAPMASFAEVTPEEHVRALLNSLPKSQQLSLF